MGRLSLDPCHHLSATGFTILAVGQDPLFFLDRQRREEEMHSHSLQEREKRKREEKIHLSLRGKGGKKCKRNTFL